MANKTFTKVTIGLTIFWALPIAALGYLLREMGGGSAAAFAAGLWIWSALLLVALLPTRPPRLVQPLAALIVFGGALLA